MLQSITSLLEYAFMRNALAAGVLVSIACGVYGTYVVIKRMSSLAAHRPHRLWRHWAGVFFQF
jgi:zinc transport system permease protein